MFLLQCRIKLKNLKSQYRYVKDRIPNIDELDLEDDEVVKDLIAKCQVFRQFHRNKMILK